MFKKNLFSIVIKLTTSITIIISSVHGQDCYDYIKQLAEKDKCLSSRIETKSLYAKTKSPSEYWSSVIESKCNGTEYACGKTLSWVTEVFEGLSSHYNEHKYTEFDQGLKAGYFLLNNGVSVRSVFTAYKQLPYKVVYHLRFTGTEDHVWVIEQLANQGGYRIYQSYHDAFSLKAWLSDSTENLYEEHDGHIMNIVSVKAQADYFIQSLTGGQININTAENLPDNYKQFLPYIKYVRDYNEKTAIENFKRAWSKYGKGEVLTWSKFENYVNILSHIVDYLNQNDNTNKAFSEKIWSYWVDLFGSPNPVHYPNLPHNGLIQYLIPDKIFRFEMKTVVFDKFEPNCQTNAYLIK